jgi:hypothetical protein
LRVAAAATRVVDVTDRNKKALYAERAREEGRLASRATELTAAAAEALRSLGATGRVAVSGESVEGKTLVARVKVPGEEPARVVKLRAHEFSSMLIVK